MRASGVRGVVRGGFMSGHARLPGRSLIVIVADGSPIDVLVDFWSGRHLHPESRVWASRQPRTPALMQPRLELRAADPARVPTRHRSDGSAMHLGFLAASARF